MNKPLRVAGLFAGAGGIELGLAESGHEAELLCEIEPTALAVLKHQFPRVRLATDVRELQTLPGIDLLTAGFPCQDLSQAGRTAGIAGARSGLVGEVFRLVEAAPPRFLLLENVPFMLQLDKGRAMDILTAELGRQGFSWAYRTVDTRAFGAPQRRQRVLLLASRTEDPRPILFSDNAAEGGPAIARADILGAGAAFGFYWTEGLKGLGWGVDCIPTLKSGSTIGIPSPPAVWRPATGEVGTPSLEDCERLQGFPVGWTEPGLTVPGTRVGARWKMVGNAVSVPLAAWVGRKLRAPGVYDASADKPILGRSHWPRAAWGRPAPRGHEHALVFAANVGMFPEWHGPPNLARFLKDPLRPLSARALAGFLSRTARGNLRFAPGFLDAVTASLARAQT